MEELNLYDDLDEFQEQQEKKSKELQEVEDKYQQSLKTIEGLREKNKTLKAYIKRMECGFQSLLDTARSEIRRKDKEIARLRKENDDICFRRKIIGKSFYRNDNPQLEHNSVVKNPFRHNIRKDNEISTETAVLLTKSPEKDEKPESNKRHRRHDDEPNISNHNKRYRSAREDKDEKYQHSSHEHGKDYQKIKEDDGGGRVRYRERVKETISKNAYIRNRSRESKEYNRSKGKNTYEKSSKSSESPDRYCKRSGRSLSRDRDKFSNKSRGLERNRSREHKNTDTFSKTTSKSPARKNKFHKDSNRDHYKNEKIVEKTATEKYNKTSDKDLREGKSKNLKDDNINLNAEKQNKFIANENSQKEKPKKFEKQNSEIVDVKIANKQFQQEKANFILEEQTNKSDKDLIKKSNNDNQQEVKNLNSNQSSQAETNNLCTPHKMSIFNEIIGSSPSENGTTTTSSTSSNSIFSNIKDILPKTSQVEIISSATTSPGNYSDISSCMSTPVNKSINFGNSACNTADSTKTVSNFQATVQNFEKKHGDRDEIDQCFIPIQNKEQNVETTSVCIDLTNVVDDDIGNEVEFIYIPGLDLYPQRKENIAHVNESTSIEIEEKIMSKKLTAGTTTTKMDLNDETTVEAFTRKNVKIDIDNYGAVNEKHTNSTTNDSIANDEVISNNEYAENRNIEHKTDFSKLESLAQNRDTDTENLIQNTKIKESSNNSESFNLQVAEPYLKNIATKSILDKFSQKQHTTISNSSALDENILPKEDFKQVLKVKNISENLGHDIVIIETLKSGGIVPLKNPYNTYNAPQNDKQHIRSVKGETLHVEKSTPLKESVFNDETQINKINPTTYRSNETKIGNKSKTEEEDKHDLQTESINSAEDTTLINKSVPYTNLKQPSSEAETCILSENMICLKDTSSTKSINRKTIDVESRPVVKSTTIVNAKMQLLLLMQKTIDSEVLITQDDVEDVQSEKENISSSIETSSNICSSISKLNNTANNTDVIEESFVVKLNTKKTLEDIEIIQCENQSDTVHSESLYSSEKLAKEDHAVEVADEEATVVAIVDPEISNNLNNNEKELKVIKTDLIETKSVDEESLISKHDHAVEISEKEASFGRNNEPESPGNLINGEENVKESQPATKEALLVLKSNIEERLKCHDDSEVEVNEIEANVSTINDQELPLKESWSHIQEDSIELKSTSEESLNKILVIENIEQSKPVFTENLLTKVDSHTVQTKEQNIFSYSKTNNTSSSSGIIHTIDLKDVSKFETAEVLPNKEHNSQTKMLLTNEEHISSTRERTTSFNLLNKSPRNDNAIEVNDKDETVVKIIDSKMTDIVINSEEKVKNNQPPFEEFSTKNVKSPMDDHDVEISEKFKTVAKITEPEFPGTSIISKEKLKDNQPPTKETLLETKSNVEESLKSNDDSEVVISKVYTNAARIFNPELPENFNKDEQFKSSISPVKEDLMKRKPVVGESLDKSKIIENIELSKSVLNKDNVQPVLTKVQQSPYPKQISTSSSSRILHTTDSKDLCEFKTFEVPQSKKLNPSEFLERGGVSCLSEEDKIENSSELVANEKTALKITEEGRPKDFNANQKFCEIDATVVRITNPEMLYNSKNSDEKAKENQAPVKEASVETKSIVGESLDKSQIIENIELSESVRNKDNVQPFPTKEHQSPYPKQNSTSSSPRILHITDSKDLCELKTSEVPQIKKLNKSVFLERADVSCLSEADKIENSLELVALKKTALKINDERRPKDFNANKKFCEIHVKEGLKEENAKVKEKLDKIKENFEMFSQAKMIEIDDKENLSFTALPATSFNSSDKSTKTDHINEVNEKDPTVVRITNPEMLYNLKNSDAKAKESQTPVKEASMETKSIIGESLTSKDDRVVEACEQDSNVRITETEKSDNLINNENKLKESKTNTKEAKLETKPIAEESLDKIQIVKNIEQPKPVSKEEKSTSLNNESLDEIVENLEMCSQTKLLQINGGKPYLTKAQVKFFISSEKSSKTGHDIKVAERDATAVNNINSEMSDNLLNSKEKVKKSHPLFKQGSMETKLVVDECLKFSKGVPGVEVKENLSNVARDTDLKMQNNLINNEELKESKSDVREASMETKLTVEGSLDTIQIEENIKQSKSSSIDGLLTKDNLQPTQTVEHNIFSCSKTNAKSSSLEILQTTKKSTLEPNNSKENIKLNCKENIKNKTTSTEDSKKLYSSCFQAFETKINCNDENVVQTSSKKYLAEASKNINPVLKSVDFAVLKANKDVAATSISDSNSKGLISSEERFVETSTVDNLDLTERYRTKEINEIEMKIEKGLQEVSIAQGSKNNTKTTATALESTKEVGTVTAEKNKEFSLKVAAKHGDKQKREVVIKNAIKTARNSKKPNISKDTQLNMDKFTKKVSDVTLGNVSESGNREEHYLTENKKLTPKSNKVETKSNYQSEESICTFKIATEAKDLNKDLPKVSPKEIKGELNGTAVNSTEPINNTINQLDVVLKPFQILSSETGTKTEKEFEKSSLEKFATAVENQKKPQIRKVSKIAIKSTQKQIVNLEGLIQSSVNFENKSKTQNDILKNQTERDESNKSVNILNQSIEVIKNLESSEIQDRFNSNLEISAQLSKNINKKNQELPARCFEMSTELINDLPNVSKYITKESPGDVEQHNANAIEFKKTINESDLEKPKETNDSENKHGKMLVLSNISAVVQSLDQLKKPLGDIESLKDELVSQNNEAIKELESSLNGQNFNTSKVNIGNDHFQNPPLNKKYIFEKASNAKDIIIQNKSKQSFKENLNMVPMNVLNSGDNLYFEKPPNMSDEIKNLNPPADQKEVEVNTLNNNSMAFVKHSFNHDSQIPQNVSGGITKYYELSPFPVGLNMGNTSAMETSKIRVLKKIITKEINIEGEIVEVVKHIVCFNENPNISESIDHYKQTTEALNKSECCKKYETETIIHSSNTDNDNNKTLQSNRGINFAESVEGKQISLTETKTSSSNETETLRNLENQNQLTPQPQDAFNYKTETNAALEKVILLPTISSALPDMYNTIPVLPSISTTIPTPSNFSGIFSKKSSYAVPTEHEVNKSKKKFTYSAKPKEYILPAASVLCNVDNLENATKASKKLHWKLLNNENEMTEIEDDADIDATDEEQIKIKDEPMENVSTSPRQYRLQKTVTTNRTTLKLSPSETDTQTEDESVLNDSRQQSEKCHKLKPSKNYKINLNKHKLPQNLKVGLNAIEMQNADAFTDNGLFGLASLKKPVGRPKKLVNKVEKNKAETILHHKKRGRKPKKRQQEVPRCIILSSKLDNCNESQLDAKEETNLKELAALNVKMNYINVEKPQKSTISTAPLKSDNNCGSDEIPETINSLENVVKILSTSVEKLEICDDLCSSKDSLKQIKSDQTQIEDCPNEGAYSTSKINHQQGTLIEDKNTLMMTERLAENDKQLQKRESCELASEKKLIDESNVSPNSPNKHYEVTLSKKQTEDIHLKNLTDCDKASVPADKPEIFMKAEKISDNNIVSTKTDTLLNDSEVSLGINKAQEERPISRSDSEIDNISCEEEHRDSKSLTKPLFKKSYKSKSLRNKDAEKLKNEAGREQVKENVFQHKKSEGKILQEKEPMGEDKKSGDKENQLKKESPVENKTKTNINFNNTEKEVKEVDQHKSKQLNEDLTESSPSNYIIKYDNKTKAENKRKLHSPEMYDKSNTREIVKNKYSGESCIAQSEYLSKTYESNLVSRRRKSLRISPPATNCFSCESSLCKNSVKSRKKPINIYRRIVDSSCDEENGDDKNSSKEKLSPNDLSKNTHTTKCEFNFENSPKNQTMSIGDRRQSLSTEKVKTEENKTDGTSKAIIDPKFSIEKQTDHLKFTEVTRENSENQHLKAIKSFKMRKKSCLKISPLDLEQVSNKSCAQSNFQESSKNVNNQATELKDGNKNIESPIATIKLRRKSMYVERTSLYDDEDKNSKNILEKKAEDNILEKDSKQNLKPGMDFSVVSTQQNLLLTRRKSTNSASILNSNTSDRESLKNQDSKTEQKHEGSVNTGNNKQMDKGSDSSVNLIEKHHIITRRKSTNQRQISDISNNDSNSLNYPKDKQYSDELNKSKTKAEKKIKKLRFEIDDTQEKDEHQSIKTFRTTVNKGNISDSINTERNAKNKEKVEIDAAELNKSIEGSKEKPDVVHMGTDNINSEKPYFASFVETAKEKTIKMRRRSTNQRQNLDSRSVDQDGGIDTVKLSISKPEKLLDNRENKQNINPDFACSVLLTKCIDSSRVLQNQDIENSTEVTHNLELNTAETRSNLSSQYLKVDSDSTTVLAQPKDIKVRRKSTNQSQNIKLSGDSLNHKPEQKTQEKIELESTIDRQHHLGVDSNSSVIKAINIRRMSTNQRRISDFSSEDDEPLIKKPNVIPREVETPLTTVVKAKQRKRRVVRVLSTTMESSPNESNTSQQSASQPSPLTSLLLNHPIFNTEVPIQSNEFGATLPMTPNQQEDKQFKEIDSKLHKIFQSPQYAVEYRTSPALAAANVAILQSPQYTEDYKTSPALVASDVTILSPPLNDSQSHVTIDETVDFNPENNQSSLNISQVNKPTALLNSTELTLNNSEIKHLSLRSAEYRFEKVSDNVVNLFISRKRKRKQNN